MALSLLTKHACNVPTLRPRATQRQALVASARQGVQVKGKVPVPNKRNAKPVKAQEEEEATIDLPVLNITVSKKVYLVLEWAVVLAQLGLADAAYSGDWSRIGIISTEVEHTLQLVVNFIIVAHTLVGVAAAYVGSTKGLNPAVAGVKGLVFGSMGLYEVMQEESALEA